MTHERRVGDEVADVQAAGLAPGSEFDMSGGDLYRHVLLQDKEEE